MKLFLINQNPVVSRMIKMSVAKAGFEFEECDNVNTLPQTHFDVVIVDDEMYDPHLIQKIQESVTPQKIGIISTTKDLLLNPDFDFTLQKPFLPTDLIELLRKIKEEIQLQRVIEAEEFKEPDTPLHQQDESDQLVEIEESQEESPFIEESLEKAGILKEEDITEVSQLLQEPEDVDMKSQEEQENAIKEPQSKKERVSMEHEVQEQEITPEELLTAATEDRNESEEAKEEQESEIASSMETQKQDVAKDVQKEIKNLGIQGLRSILDGMQLEITIKISYPDRKDV